MFQMKMPNAFLAVAICTVALISSYYLKLWGASFSTATTLVAKEENFGEYINKTVSQEEFNFTITDTDSTSQYSKQKQIQNYINGTGLILNVHITHHAGTFLCSVMQYIGPTPSFVCMGGDNWPSGVPNTHEAWHEEQGTATMVEQIRPHFHFLSHEYGYNGDFHTLQKIDWEYKNLISMIVMRDPIDRFLAGGRCGTFHENLKGDPTPEQESQDKWWDYANSRCADNYALRILSDNPNCCTHNDTDRAMKLLERFTFIIYQDCLSESIGSISDTLNLTGVNNATRKSDPLHRIHKTARERITNDTLWEFLNDKFRHDIALYEWSKNHSIVKCS